MQHASPLTRSGTIPLFSHLITRLAPEIGARVILEPEYGYTGQIIYANGRRVLFKSGNFDINPGGSLAVARDKGFTKYFLSESGYRVPTGNTFFSEAHNRKLRLRRDIHDGYAFAADLGFPVILKPNNLSRGQLVGRVYGREEYYPLAEAILAVTEVMIVEEFYEGRDYRLVVLDDTVVAAYERIHLGVTGDGRSTVRDLLHAKQEVIVARGRGERIDHLDSVIPSGETVRLLDNANLSTGGDSHDVTPHVHPDFMNIAVSATRDMGLRLCGVDILTDDITRPMTDYRIIEMNGAP